MRRLLVILGIAIVIAVVAVVVSQFLKPDPPPPPILPSASPTIGPITSVGDLYREEVRLNEIDVEGADTPYEEAVRQVAP